MGNDDSPRPGFDRWVSFKGQGTYRDPDINEDGKLVKPSGYITDILNDYAVEFIRRRRDKPFLVYLAHKAIHPEVAQNNDGSVNLADSERFIPAERHKNLYAGKPIPRRPNYGRAPEGKPALQRRIGALPPLGSATVTSNEAILGRQRSLMAIEDGVGAIFNAGLLYAGLVRKKVLVRQPGGRKLLVQIVVASALMAAFLVVFGGDVQTWLAASTTHRVGWLAAIVAGGAGVYFVAADRRFYHSIWHLFVLAGSACHFLAVLQYLEFRAV